MCRRDYRREEDPSIAFREEFWSRNLAIMTVAAACVFIYPNIN